MSDGSDGDDQTHDVSKTQILFDAAETIVRGIKTNWHANNGKIMKGGIENLQSKLLYLTRQAASEFCWKPEFLEMLKHAHSIRVSPVSKPMKEGLRYWKMRCMACGRWETCCAASIDMCGPFDRNAWFGPVRNLPLAWKRFESMYCEQTDTIESSAFGKLSDHDFGSFTLGETCMRRATLYFKLNTLFMDLCYDVSTRVKAHIDSGRDLQEGYFVTGHEEEAVEWQQKLEELQRACADDKLDVGDLEVDHGLWDTLYEARDRASDGDVEKRTVLLCKQSLKTMKLYSKPPAERHVQEDAREEVQRSEDEEEDEEEEEYKVVCSQKRRRRGGRVLSDDEGCDENEGSEVEGAAPANKRHLPHKETNHSSPSMVPSVVPSAGSNGGGGVVVDDNGPSAALIARDQRLPGLPSDRVALLRLMGLQTELMREGRDKQAAVCSESILVIQQLMAKVTQLRHTRE